MTRSEFMSWEPTIEELIDFCNSNGIEVLHNLYTEQDRDCAIWDEIHSFDGSWEELTGYLDDIPTGFDYYERDPSMWFEYIGIDDSDIPDFKDRITEVADGGGIWEDEQVIPDEWLYSYYESEDSDSEMNADDDAVFESVMSLEELYAAGAVFINN